MTGMKEKLKEDYPWIVYITLFLAVLILFFIFNRLDLFHTNPDSARYMLSALVQSEAAIIAIVITLSLTAVQITATTYSPRITDLFKDSLDLKILLTSYIVAIGYGLAVLKTIDSKDNSEFLINSCFFLGIFCLLALIPYIYNVLVMLKPSTIIKKLSNDITKENFLKRDFEADPIQPIIDITRSSIIKYDYETMRISLQFLSDGIYNLIENCIFSEEEMERISLIIDRHFLMINQLSIKTANEYFVMEINDKLNEIYKSILNKSFKKASVLNVKCFLSIAISSSERRYLDIIKNISKYLTELDRMANEKNLNEVTSEIIPILALIDIEIKKIQNSTPRNLYKL